MPASARPGPVFRGKDMRKKTNGRVIRSASPRGEAVAQITRPMSWTFTMPNSPTPLRGRQADRARWLSVSVPENVRRAVSALPVSAEGRARCRLVRSFHIRFALLQEARARAHVRAPEHRSCERSSGGLGRVIWAQRTHGSSRSRALHVF